MTKKIFSFGIGLLFLLITAPYIYGAGVDLAWNAPTEGGPVEGYYLYWKTSSGSYSDANRIAAGCTKAEVPTTSMVSQERVSAMARSSISG